MRELKFRAWYKGQEFVEGHDPQMVYDVQNLYDGNGTSNIELMCGYSSFGSILADEDFVVMQYIGVNDADGKEIYEGDIVQIIGHWSKKTPLVRAVTYEGASFLPFDDSDWGWWEGATRVVGNIYENHELLNGIK